MTNTPTPKKHLVKIYTTNKLQIQGEILIKEQSYRGRLSDILNDSKLFITVLNAEVYTPEGRLIKTFPFICINKQSITFAVED